MGTTRQPRPLAKTEAIRVELNLGGLTRQGLGFAANESVPKGMGFEYSILRMKKNQDRQPFLSVTMKDCDLQTFRCGGPGGQNVNKVNSGVRITHRVSGAVGEARDSRSQLQNKKAA
jgi:hypothetical protein